MRRKEAAMIELTQQQRQQLEGPEPVAIDPQTNEQYVLVRKDVYERMKELLYDDSPWTDEERDALAWEAGRSAGWDDMGEYDHYPEGPRGQGRPCQERNITSRRGQNACRPRTDR
jgi:hypothetical protein